MLLLILLPWPLLTAARDSCENDHASWNAEIAAFQAAEWAHPPAPGAVLFIGSSSIRLWTSLVADFPGTDPRVCITRWPDAGKLGACGLRRFS